MMSKNGLLFLIFILLILPTWFLSGTSAGAGREMDVRTTSLEKVPSDVKMSVKRDADENLGIAEFVSKLERNYLMVRFFKFGDFAAHAQDDSQHYPGPEADKETSNKSPDAVENNTNTDPEDPAGDGGTPAYPADIDKDAYPADSLATASPVESQNTEPASSLAGMVYLWMAFIAAIVILSAAVLGAILLYTRQRTTG